jgi:hypothetical protein
MDPIDQYDSTMEKTSQHDTSMKGDMAQIELQTAEGYICMAKWSTLPNI